MAEHDLADIADYTTDVWGPQQAELYLNKFADCFSRIAANPALGRPCPSVHAAFRRVELGKHVIFYQPREREVFISRVLHQSMLPGKHDIQED